MAPRKGLSFDEKRDRLLDLFTETAEFFTLKELEKVAHKRKGIVSQSVKEVLQSLVDDDIVSTDKCGNQTVYWCLPSEASQKKKARLEKLQEEVASKKMQLEELKARVEAMQAGREQTEEHAALMESVSQRRSRAEELRTQLERFAEFDPEEIKRLTDSMVPLRDAANRWTDNIFCCQSWICNKFGMERAMFFEQFEVSPELDYVE